MRCAFVAMSLILAMPAAYAGASKECSITAGRWNGKMDFSWGSEGCSDARHCHEGNSDMVWSRWSGIAPGDLQREGATIDARMKAEAGEMRCTGTVHDGALRGEYSFTSSEEFARQMQTMGFDGQTPERLQGYAFLDVTTAWTRDMKNA